MRATGRLMALGLMLGLAAASQAGDPYKCTATTQECLDMMVAYWKGSGWVGLELDREETGELTIKRLVPDSPAVEAGFQVGDVLLAVNGIRYDDMTEEARERIQRTKKPGARFTFTVRRKGREREIPVVLASMPEDVVAVQIGLHLLEHATVARKDAP